MVSAWRSVIAVSLNISGGARLINTTNTMRTGAQRQVCMVMVLSVEPLGKRMYENWITTARQASEINLLTHCNTA